MRKRMVALVLVFCVMIGIVGAMAEVRGSYQSEMLPQLEWSAEEWTSTGLQRAFFVFISLEEF